VDEFTREALAIRVDRKLSSAEVIETLAELMLERGVPEHIRSDNGSEFVAQAVRDWISAVGAKTATIEPGSPWENGYVESFNSKLRDELLNREIFYSLKEAQILIEGWRQHNNAIRPHSALRWTPPAPEVRLPKPQVRPATTLAHYAQTKLSLTPEPGLGAGQLTHKRTAVTSDRVAGIACLSGATWDESKHCPLWPTALSVMCVDGPGPKR
jgi:hypothetical protein